MYILKGRDVNEVYGQLVKSLQSEYQWHVFHEYPSRNGPMIEFSAPVTSVYLHPCERVLFDAVRDCNPFLHFFESLWMLAGRNDLAFLTQFSKNMANFSDNGKTLNGAYGYRWRHHMGYDQLDWAIRELTDNPNSRRVVIQMWDGVEDQSSKDIPCNTSVMWRLRGGVLDMTVTNRSNDAIWGCYGANAVHFSYLHEYIAASVGVTVGTYYQVSNSLHVYPELPVVQRVLEGRSPILNENEYRMRDVEHFPLFSGGATRDTFDMDLNAFFHLWDTGEDVANTVYETRFFNEVVIPVWEAFYGNNIDYRVLSAGEIAATDWRMAVIEWLERREK